MNIRRAPDFDILAQIREARRSELRTREGSLRLWRDMDMDAARVWKEWQAETGVDLTADIARCVRWAREWNTQLIRLKYRKKLQ